MSTIYFRTDGNEEIATGHIMRCLSIARACLALHADVSFIVSDEMSEAILKERFVYPDEFSIQCLHSKYNDMEAELPILTPILSDDCLLFIDSYFVTETYLNRLHKLCKIAYLDDILAFDYPVDLIINYDVSEEPACYRKASMKLLGAAYTPLREQFQNVSYEVRPEVQNIFISTGGTDKYNLSGNLLKKIFISNFAPKHDTSVTFFDSTLRKYHYHIITGRLNSHFEELEKLACIYPTIHIHENVQNMAELMCSCDLGISAGGTTLYEICAVGVPAISFSISDNQLNAVETFSSNKIISYAGNYSSSPEKVTDAIIRFIMDNAVSYEQRKKSSHIMRAFIDGNGCARIAAALITGNSSGIS